MFQRHNPLGWVPGDPLTSSQINGIDVNQSRAIDGTGGSDGVPYTPASVIEIGGAGVKLSGSGSAGWIQVPTRTLVRAEPLRISGMFNAFAANDPHPTVSAYYDVREVTGALYPAITAPPHGQVQTWDKNEFVLQITPPCNSAVLKHAVITFSNLLSNQSAIDSGIGVAQFRLWAFGIGASPGYSYLTTALGPVAQDIPLGTQTPYDFQTGRQVTVSTYGSGYVANAEAQTYGLWVKNPYGPDNPNAAGARYYGLWVTWTITTIQPA